MTMRYLRSIPFGYQIADGVLCTHMAESGVVKSIFADYVAGSSYNTIAQRLDGGPIPYGENSPAWNKNMVKRIIENTRYTGENGYPAIIDAELFAKARAVQESKTLNYREVPQTVTLVRKHLVCAHCGEKYTRDTRTKRHDYWVCRNEACPGAGRWEENDLLRAIAQAMNILIRQPDMVESPDIHIQKSSPELNRLTYDLMRQMESGALDAGIARSLILNLAAERYQLCDDGQAGRDASAIRERLAAATPGESICHSLFQAIVSTVMIAAEGSVSLRLKSGQVVPSACRE